MPARSAISIKIHPLWWRLYPKLRPTSKKQRRNGLDARKIWASGGNPFALSTEKQIAVWDLMRTYYPKARISTYAIISDSKHKSVEEICKIKAHGLDEIMIGIETGDDEVLSLVNKGYTSEEIIEAGLPYEVIFLSGLGGRGYGLGHAQKSADILNQLHLDRILIAGLTLFPDTPLMKDVRSGVFKEATEERVLELKEFLTRLKNPTLIDATNASIITPIYGRIPEEKDKMIAQLDAIFIRYGEAGLRQARESLPAS